MSPSAGGSCPARALRVPPARSSAGPGPRPRCRAPLGTPTLGRTGQRIRARPSPSSAPPAGELGRGARDTGMVSLLPPDGPRPPPSEDPAQIPPGFLRPRPFWGGMAGAGGTSRPAGTPRGSVGARAEGANPAHGRANRAGGTQLLERICGRGRSRGNTRRCGGSVDPPGP